MADEFPTNINLRSDAFANFTIAADEETNAVTVMELVLYFLLLVATLVTIFGNSLVITAFIRDKRIREKPANLYILNLSVSDFIVGVFVMPIYLASKVFPLQVVFPRWTKYCFWWQLLTMFGFLSSFHSLIVITYDRFKLVRDPFAYYVTHQTYQTTLKYLVASWISSLSTITCYFAFLSFDHPTQGYRNDACGILRPTFREYPVLKYGTILEPLALCAVLIILNTGIVVHLYRRSKELTACAVDQESTSPGEAPAKLDVEDLPQGDDMNVDRSPTNSESFNGNDQKTRWRTNADATPHRRWVVQNRYIVHLKKCRKAIHKLFILVSVYMVCFSPWFAVTIMKSFGHEVNYTVIEVANIFMWLNSMVNPFLYASTNVRLRTGMRNVLRA